MRKSANLFLAASTVALALTACSDRKAEENEAAEAKVVESAYPERVYWGDTHLHTSNSIDAFGFGVRLDPEAALRFARGEEVIATGGLKVKLETPLDFLVIADHSDGLGLTRKIYDTPGFLLRDPLLRRWHDMMHEGPEGSLRATSELITMAAKGQIPKDIMSPETQAKTTKSIWSDHLGITEKFNEPGKFTAFLGFEYTLMPNGDNLHRVVVFKDGKRKVDQVLPYSSLVGTNIEMLWDYMDAYEKKTGGKVLAIPHNSNVSNGLMFETTGPGGKEMTADYARRRAAREPIVEATQIKGDSESHPLLSPDDEFADFGDAGWETGNLTLTALIKPGQEGGNYVREALKRGLALEAKTGVNPYKMGMIGSTDSHTSLATGDDNNFFGKHSGTEPNPKRLLAPQNLGTNTGRYGYHYLASGYAGVWAKANTRKALFEAMERKEVYASTGPRITLRFFGGNDFTANDLKGDWVKAGYSRGVPMGGDLKATEGKAPSFIVSAVKDPKGANLDRVQVVKGWVDAEGKSHEKIFDVVWSDQAKRPQVNGKLTPVGDTVDLKTATYKNTIGAPQLMTVWSDPEFNPALKSFYYLRVLEIPTPSWTAYDAVKYKLTLPANVKGKAQERAYTSPIWYSPKG